MSVISPTSDLWLSYELAYFHFFTLQDMKRPFKPMKDLDMDEVVSDIVAKLKWRAEPFISMLAIALALPLLYYLKFPSYFG